MYIFMMSVGEQRQFCLCNEQAVKLAEDLKGWWFPEPSIALVPAAMFVETA